MSRAWSDEDLGILQARGLSPPDDKSRREAASIDFGRLVRGSPSAVVCPRSIADLTQIIALANERGAGLVPRALGLSQSGQAIPSERAALDLSRLDRVLDVDVVAGTVTCEAGATFRALVAATAPHGMLPAVLPLNLDLTVGGVLSVGGIGATSHTHGAVVAQVARLVVIAGDGRVIECSDERERHVLDAVLGGLGACGVIASATLRLRRIRRNVRTFFCVYDDLDHWLDDQRTLVATKRAHYLEAFSSPVILGFRNGPKGRGPFAEWRHVIHVSVEYDHDPPEEASLLAGLRPQHIALREDNDTIAYTDRYAPRFAAMRRSGAWQLPHPWVEAIVPVSAIPSLLPRVLEQLPPALGEIPRVLFLERRGLPRIFMVPDAAELAVLALTPVGVPPHLHDDVLDVMRSIHALIVEAGGKRYLSGWTGMMGSDEVREHYGDRLLPWLEACRSLDPRQILGGSMFISQSGLFMKPPLAL